MAKAYGFDLISIINLRTAYNSMLNEGTCCLAYADFTNQHVAMLLFDRPDLQALRKDESINSELWDQLDNEIIQAIIHLRTMANSDLLTLHWCQNCKVISMTPFDCPCNDTFDEGTEKVHFGIDFSDGLYGVTDPDLLINTLEGAKVFLRACGHVFGQGFHVDTMGASYVNNTGRTFTDDQAEVFDMHLAAAVNQFERAGLDICLGTGTHIRHDTRRPT